MPTLITIILLTTIAHAESRNAYCADLDRKINHIVFIDPTNNIYDSMSEAESLKYEDEYSMRELCESRIGQDFRLQRECTEYLRTCN